jgi:hypothetical protein
MGRDEPATPAWIGFNWLRGGLMPLLMTFLSRLIGALLRSSVAMIRVAFLLLAQIDRGFELRTVVCDGRFYFDELLKQFRRNAIDVLANCVTLSFQAEAALTLLSCTDSKVADVYMVIHSIY